MTIVELLLIFQINYNSVDINNDQALFVWDLELVNEEVFESIQGDGFTTLYVYCSDSNAELFKDVLVLSNAYELDVYALNGSYEWIDKKEKLDQFFLLVNDYISEEYPHFRGVVLDIEPYVMDDRDEDKDYVIFKELIESAKLKASELGIELNVVIPFWYEKVKLNLLGHQESLAQWVISIADETTIMAYRNEVFGKNGIISLIDEEILLSILYQKDLIIALETNPSDEGDHISFSESNHEKLFNTISLLKKRLIFDWKNIHYAVHDLESWLELE